MTSSNHSGRNCLKLEALHVGSKVGAIKGDVIDDNAKAILKQCPELEYMLVYIEKHLKETYPKVFDGTLDKMVCLPLMYDYGVENKNAKKALAMQYGNEEDIKERIEELESSKKFEDVKESSFFK